MMPAILAFALPASATSIRRLSSSSCRAEGWSLACAKLARHWAVGVADIAPGDYGWGFVKLEPLFGPAGERFLVVDSDTVFTGPVLDAFATSAADFLVDDEQQSETDTRRLYYDWRKVAAIDPLARPPQFVFNSGQWFGTAGVLMRDDFAPWVDWTMPRRLKHPDCFMPGEPGVLNYVLNQKAALGAPRVERRRIMRWPGHGIDGITPMSIINRTAPAVVVHWAGFKAARLRALPGADVLSLFERCYHAKLPLGFIGIRLRTCRYVVASVARSLSNSPAASTPPTFRFAGRFAGGLRTLTPRSRWLNANEGPVAVLSRQARLRSVEAGFLSFRNIALRRYGSA